MEDVTETKQSVESVKVLPPSDKELTDLMQKMAQLISLKSFEIEELNKKIKRLENLRVSLEGKADV